MQKDELEALKKECTAQNDALEQANTSKRIMY